MDAKAESYFPAFDRFFSCSFGLQDAISLTQCGPHPRACVLGVADLVRTVGAV
jgi:hypothetical protein